jgi:hypothetical protein
MSRRTYVWSLWGKEEDEDRPRRRRDPEWERIRRILEDRAWAQIPGPRIWREEEDVEPEW